MNNDNIQLQVTKFIPAEIEKVFKAWTDPKIVQKWFCPVGMRAEVSEWVAKEGGHYRISMIDGEDVYATNGMFLEVSPVHKIAFTYGWEEGDRVETDVIVEFKNLDDGTDITLTHEGIDPEEVSSHKEGWESALNNLARQF